MVYIPRFTCWWPKCNGPSAISAETKCETAAIGPSGLALPKKKRGAWRLPRLCNLIAAVSNGNLNFRSGLVAEFRIPTYPRAVHKTPVEILTSRATSVRHCHPPITSLARKHELKVCRETCMGADPSCSHEANDGDDSKKQQTYPNSTKLSPILI